MSFSLPTFNVPVNIWNVIGINTTIPPVGPPTFAGVLANVSLGRRQLTGTDASSAQRALSGVGIDILYRIMMFPAGTDVRSPFQDLAFKNDSSCIEMPAGSGAYYFAVDVADMAKGFSNEHRVCWAIPSQNLGLPSPLP